MQEAGSAALACAVHVQCVLCGGGPVESGRWFAELGPLYCTAAEGGAKRGGLLFGSFPPVAAARSNAPARPRRGGTSRVPRGKKRACLSVGGRQPCGGATGWERSTGGAAAAALVEDRTTIPPRFCPNLPPALGSAPGRPTVSVMSRKVACGACGCRRGRRRHPQLP